MRFVQPNLIVGMLLALFSAPAHAQDAKATEKGKLLEPVKSPMVVPESDAAEGLILSRDSGSELDPILRIYGEYPATTGSLGRLMGDRKAPGYKDPKGKVVAMEVLRNGDVLFGPNLGIARRKARESDPHSRMETDPQHTSPIDFYWDAQDRKLHVRSILLTENGDPADLAFRRSGDETYPYGPPMGIKAGTNLGTMYWMGWAADNYGFNDRVAQLYAKAAEDITAQGSGGSLHFSTTPVGSTRPLERVVIAPSGHLGVGTPRPQARLHVAAESGGLAEDYPSTQKLEAGDVVAIDSDGDALSVVRTATPYDQKAVGIVAKAPAVRVSRANPSYFQDPDTHNPIDAGYPVAHSGRSEVKVSSENGAIHPGDYLTSSSVAGVAMKATSKGAVIGKALQGYSKPAVGRIQVLVDVTWYTP